MRPEADALPAVPLESRHGACWLWRDGESDGLSREAVSKEALSKEALSKDHLDEQFLLQHFLQVFSPDGVSAGSPIATGGRGSAWRVEIDGRSYVCRQYRRGGLIARFNQDLYLWSGAHQTRPYQEWVVMHQAANAGLHVPRPLAAIACKTTGLFYRAAILTPWVEHEGSLASVEREQAWFNAGQSIAHMHAALIWHADLNVHNILIDQQDRAWLIDFDRARSHVSDPKVLRGNLTRLLRSVNKVCPDLGQRVWPVLCDGYASG